MESSKHERRQRGASRAPKRLRYELPEILPVGVFHTDGAGRYVYVNDRWCSLAGISREEAQGRGWTRALHPEDRDLIIEQWDCVVGAGARFESEFRFQRSDGTTTWVLGQAACTRNRYGRVDGYVGTITDITDRKAAEAALRESEDHYRDLVEHSQELMCTHDLEGRILSINAAAVRVSGYAAEFFLNRNVRDFLAPKYRDEFDSYLDTIKRDGVAHGVMKVVTRTGEKRIWEYKNTLRTSGIEVPVVRGMARDVTEPRRAQEALAKLASIVESSYDAIIGQTVEGIITSWNAGAERTFGHSPPEAQGKSLAILFPPDRSGELGPLLDRLEREERIRCETVWQRRNGERIDVSLTISAIRNASGKTLGASTIARDITDRKRLEAERERLLAAEREARREAEAANRTKDEFLAVVSHELRTPLTSILGWARQLRRGKLEPGAAESALEIIERNARVQAQLIDDILDVSRIITGNLRLEFQPVAAATVIALAIDVVRPAADRKSIELMTGMQGDLVVSADPNRLQQIVWNLLSNAVKFTPSGGRVEVCLEPAGPNARIKVRDTGKGISPEFLAFVFDRFSQADSTTTRVHAGLGLGLAIVRHLVELHGGLISAESDGEGRGATFSVELPLSTAQEVRESNLEMGQATTYSLRSLTGPENIKGPHSVH